MNSIYYVSEADDYIGIDRAPGKNTVFFSTDFELVLDWVFGPDTQSDDEMYDLDPAGGTGRESHR
jgi:hypothetical protein